MRLDPHNPLFDPKAEQARVAALAKELGTRGAARRLGINKDTVTRYLHLTEVQPAQLTLKVRRNGPRGFVATASGLVRSHGKVRRMVRFVCTVEALTLREVLEAVVHQALAAARTRAGSRG